MDCHPIPKVVYSCSFIPMEWIAAHELFPCRITPVVDELHYTTGVCPYAGGFGRIRKDDSSIVAYVLTTLCDPMRRISEWMECDSEESIFLFNLPSTWQSQSARQYYVDELQRLGKFLVRLQGNSPTPAKLAQVMRCFDSARQFLISSRRNYSSRTYADAILDFQQKGISAISIPNFQECDGGIPLAVLGGPILKNDLSIFDVIEQSGGWVALLGTENGERGFPTRFDADRLSDDPFEELIHAYFDEIPDPSRRPNDQLYSWLSREISERQIRGMIVLYYPWCDLWHAEIQRIKETFSIPVIDIQLDTVDGMHTQARNQTRIQALLDMLR